MFGQPIHSISNTSPDWLSMHGLKKCCYLRQRPLIRERAIASPRPLSSLLGFIGSGDSSSSAAAAADVPSSSPSSSAATAAADHHHASAPQQQQAQQIPKKHHLQSAFDTSPNWRDWFQPAEYDNPWDKSYTGTPPPGGATALSRFKFPLDNIAADTAARHMIYLLQNFHRFENATTVDWSTQYCRKGGSGFGKHGNGRRYAPRFASFVYLVQGDY
jgi:hypothetical protein